MHVKNDVLHISLIFNEYMVINLDGKCGLEFFCIMIWAVVSTELFQQLYSIYS